MENIKGKIKNTLTAKNALCVLFGVAVIVAGYFVGRWNKVANWLLLFMVADYATGLIVAAVFKNSPKSETGALKSDAGIKGIFRKGGMLILVVIGKAADEILGTQYIMNGVIIALCVNEIISLSENLGLMGVPFPNVIVNALELLRQKDNASVQQQNKKGE